MKRNSAGVGWRVAAWRDLIRPAWVLALCLAPAGAGADSGVDALRRRAESGDASAQYELGLMHDQGRGAARDYGEARRWYRKAAEQGHAKAQNNLGALFEAGQGGAVDYEQAMLWYRQAAQRGNRRAHYNLGAMYEHGKGGDSDPAQARRHYEQAAALGDERAREALRRLGHAAGQATAPSSGTSLTGGRPSRPDRAMDPEARTTGADALAIESMSRAARLAPACSSKVPLEYARAYPVPASRSKALEFRLLFYPLLRPGPEDSEASGPRVLPPPLAGRFSLASKEVRCEPFAADVQLDAGKDLGPTLGPRARTLDGPDFELLEADLYWSLARVSRSYAQGSRSQEARDHADAFLTAFLRVAEPGLAPYYFKVNPEFWDWIKELTGRGIADKAAVP